MTFLGDQWPELLGVLFQASQSPDAGLREAAFRIFSTTPGIIEKPHEDAVQGVFGKGFKDDVVSVRSPSSTAWRNCRFFDRLFAGAHCCHGGFRFLLPLDFEEISAQVFPARARPPQRFASAEGIVRERRAFCRIPGPH